MLFETQHFGKPISPELSEYLKSYTDKHDVADVATRMQVSTSTIRDVKLRSNPVSEKNAPAIIELVRVAIANCTRRIVLAKQAKKDLVEMVGNEFQTA